MGRKKSRGRSGSGPKTNSARLAPMHPDAAGIDIGSRSHFVAVPPDRDDRSVREFGAFTADLYALADWLTECRVTSVALESTGVYWIPLFEVLEERGFEAGPRRGEPHAQTPPGYPAGYQVEGGSFEGRHEPIV